MLLTLPTLHVAACPSAFSGELPATLCPQPVASRGRVQVQVSARQAEADVAEWEAREG